MGKSSAVRFSSFQYLKRQHSAGRRLWRAKRGLCRGFALRLCGCLANKYDYPVNPEGETDAEKVKVRKSAVPFQNA